MWEWRNDPQAREASFNSVPIEWTQHIKWFEAALADDAKKIFVIEHEGRKAGVLRLDQVDRGDWKISIMIAPLARGRGLALAALREAVRTVDEHPLIERVIALVKPENTVSLRAFSAAGFEVTERTDSAVTLVYTS